MRLECDLDEKTEDLDKGSLWYCFMGHAVYVKGCKWKPYLVWGLGSPCNMVYNKQFIASQAFNRLEIFRLLSDPCWTMSMFDEVTWNSKS